MQSSKAFALGCALAFYLPFAFPFPLAFALGFVSSESLPIVRLDDEELESREELVSDEIVGAMILIWLVGTSSSAAHCRQAEHVPVLRETQTS